MQKREGGNTVLIIIGIIAILFLIGFFRNQASFWDTVNFKKALRLPCGLTVSEPRFSKDEKVVFPLTISGYINGCGWDLSGRNAGTAQVFDAHGAPVTAPATLLAPSDPGSTPYLFSTTLFVTAAPQTDTGQILFRSTTGLLYSQPVSF